MEAEYSSVSFPYSFVVWERFKQMCNYCQELRFMGCPSGFNTSCGAWASENSHSKKRKYCQEFFMESQAWKHPVIPVCHLLAKVNERFWFTYVILTMEVQPECKSGPILNPWLVNVKCIYIWRQCKISQNMIICE